MIIPFYNRIIAIFGTSNLFSNLATSDFPLFKWQKNQPGKHSQVIGAVNTPFRELPEDHYKKGTKLEKLLD